MKSRSLLLPAAPTLSWGRCGKHNSPPACSVMNFILCRSYGSHVPFDTVHPSLLRSSSHSSPRCMVPSPVFFPTYSWSRLLTRPNHLTLAYLHLSVMVSTLSLSVMSSFLTWYLSVWPHVHLHIFITVTSSFFTWELAERSYCVYFPSRVMVLSCRIGRLSSSP